MTYTGGFGGSDEITAFADRVKASAVGGGKLEQLKAGGLVTAVQLAEQEAERFSKTPVGQVVRSSFQVGGNLYNAVEQIRKGKMDASGVASFTAAGFSAFEGVAAIMQVAGAGAVAGEMMKWAQTGAQCAVGAAVGPVGWLGCGLSVLSNLLDYAFGASESAEAWSTPRSIFIPNENSAHLMAMDAARLASLLRFHYGVQSYAKLYGRMLGLEHYKWLCSAQDSYGDHTGTYPIAPLKNTSTGKIVARDNKQVPAHNLRTILHVMSLGLTGAQADRNGQDAFVAVAGWRHGLEPAGWGLYKRYIWDQDVNQHAIGTAAYWGRMALAATGAKTHIVQAAVRPVGNTTGWRWPTSTALQPNLAVKFPIDVRPFIFVDELINFFGGVTARELETGGNAARNMLVSQYGLGTYAPVRHLFVRDDGDRTAQNRTVMYGQSCTTNLERTVENCAVQNFLLSWNRNNNFLRDIGVMRLCAAFSFLHNTFLWSSPGVYNRQDLIAGVEEGTTPVENAVLSPVDPRSIYVRRPTEEQATNGRRQASLDRAATQISVTGSTIANSATYDPRISYAQTTISPTFLSAKVAQEQAALQAGPRAASPPKVMSTWYKATTPQDVVKLLTQPNVQAAIEAQAQTQSSAGTAVLLGGAALLALKFLK